MRSLRSPAAAVLVGALVLSGCTQLPGPAPGPSDPPGESPATATGVQPAGDPSDVVTGLVAPWSMAPLPADDGPGEGAWLVSQRDDAAVLLLTPRAGGGYEVRRAGTVPGVAHGGEGGLLGLAFRPRTSSAAGAGSGAGGWVYAYLTTAADNRIVRIPFRDGALRGEPELVLEGIPRAGNHDGGRLAFGPDGMLYATAGDAGQPGLAQDPSSLGGKILRMTPEGDVPGDNPIPGSYVYSLGHRNPQGIAWDADGRLWAAEFGQNTWDEFNRVEPGGNYGWPEVEGMQDEGAADQRYIDPWAQWPTSEASPSGLTFIGGTFFLAALRGQRLWAISVDEEAGSAEPVAWFAGEYGRIRDVAPGPDGSLWMLTNNTDGRGDPRDGDDRILQVRLAEVQEG